MSMIVNRRDLDFLMYEVFDLDRILATKRYGNYDREVVTAVLDTAQSIAEDKFLPCAAKLAACRYFYRYELPTVYARFALVASLDDTCMGMTPEKFVGQ